MENETPLMEASQTSGNPENPECSGPHGFEPGNRRFRAIGRSPAMPALPIQAAMLCCCLNFVLPGLGTFVAGLGQCCCRSPERNVRHSRFMTFSACCYVAIAQLLLTPIFFIGWLWSCIWGIGFVVTSVHVHSLLVAEESEAGERGRRRGLTIVISRGSQRRGRLLQPQGPPSYDDVVKSDADRRSQLGVILEQPEDAPAAAVPDHPSDAPPPYSP